MLTKLRNRIISKRDYHIEFRSLKHIFIEERQKEEERIKKEIEDKKKTYDAMIKQQEQQKSTKAIPEKTQRSVIAL